MQVGDYRLEIIPDTEFRLDGGAMFGVVPRNLWSQLCPPDEQNRIRMNMNCVLVDTGTEKILIETGIGNKWSAKQSSLYAIDRTHTLAETLQIKTGITAEEVTIVVNTHLHFDHAGGNTRLNESQQLVASFPNARYLVSRAELEHAAQPSERDRASYLPENWEPLMKSGQLEAREGDYKVASGLQMETFAGHNRSMQCWHLNRGGQTVFGFADLVPMRPHLKPAWIMGYDLYPLETLQAKKELLPRAVRGEWLCLFYHDPDAPLCHLVETGKGIEAVPIANQDASVA